MRFVVLHTVRAGARVHRTARLVITDVPEKTDASAVMEALEQAGRAGEFAEQGVAWGNHEVKSEKALPKGTTGVDEAPIVAWADLTGTQTLRRVTLRLEPAIYDQVHLAARRAGKSIQTWCVEALHTAATSQDGQPTARKNRSKTR